jgi:hypothetical protein
VRRTGGLFQKAGGAPFRALSALHEVPVCASRGPSLRFTRSFVCGRCQSPLSWQRPRRPPRLELRPTRGCRARPRYKMERHETPHSTHANQAQQGAARRGYCFVHSARPGARAAKPCPTWARKRSPGRTCRLQQSLSSSVRGLAVMGHPGMGTAVRMPDWAGRSRVCVCVCVMCVHVCACVGGWGCAHVCVHGTGWEGDVRKIDAATNG